jgi:transcriptional regulator
MYLPERYAMNQMQEVRLLVAMHGWALLACNASGELKATHLPCLLDPDHDLGGDAPELVIVGHAARADPQAGSLAAGEEVLLVFQGPHGYISPAWYEDGPSVPTWNYSAVHVWGVPQILEGEEGFHVLERTVEHFEQHRDEPWRLSGAEDYARKIAVGTLPFRLRASRLEAKAKLSQDKPVEIRERVITALERPGPYRQPSLAGEMRRELAKDNAPDHTS